MFGRSPRRGVIEVRARETVTGPCIRENLWNYALELQLTGDRFCLRKWNQQVGQPVVNLDLRCRRLPGSPQASELAQLGSKELHKRLRCTPQPEANVAANENPNKPTL